MAAPLADAARDGHPVSGGAAARRRTAIPGGQLAALFAYSLVNWSVGNGLLPLLPEFAAGLGAPPEAVGIYLGISYAAIALGTAVAGWLADRVGHRKESMVLVGLAITPLFLVTSQTGSFGLVVLLTAAVWFLAGMALAFASIVAGLWAGPDERGRVLGMLAVAAPTGSIVGGLGIGVLADRVGYPATWEVLGLLYLLCPAAGLFVREAPRRGGTRAGRAAPAGSLRSMAFLILLGSSLLAAFGTFLATLGRSLVMEEQQFSRAELTSTVAVSGAVTLPFPFLLGFLSDRLGRLRFLALCYAAGVGGLAVYAGAMALWQFALASALVAFVSYVSTGVGSALVVDLVERPAVGRGLALYSAIGWSGGILGFAVGGYLFHGIGSTSSFYVGAGLLGVALLLLPPIGWAMASAQRRRTSPAEIAARKE